MIALVILGGVLYKTFVGNNRDSTVIDGLSWTDDRNSVFIPPKEREEHLSDKKNLDLSNPENVRKLKQSLMKRTFVSIPYLLELQTQGPSADKLYKRGMMTDAMYDRCVPRTTVRLTYSPADPAIAYFIKAKGMWEITH